MRRSDRPQVTYFVQRGGADGPIKIGVTSNVQKRVKTLATGSAEPLALLAAPQVRGMGARRALRVP